MYHQKKHWEGFFRLCPLEPGWFLEWTQASPLNCIFKLLKQTELITYPVRADKNGGCLIVEVMFLSEEPDYLNIIMHIVQLYSLSTVFSCFSSACYIVKISSFCGTWLVYRGQSIDDSTNFYFQWHVHCHIALTCILCYCFWFTYCKVWIIVQLAEDSDSSNDIRVLGGIPLLLALLQ